MHNVQVLLPPLLPPLLTGTALAFSRALGEFGSIVILSSNFAFKVGVVIPPNPACVF